MLILESSLSRMSRPSHRGIKLKLEAQDHIMDSEQPKQIDKIKHNEEQLDGSRQAIYPKDPLIRRRLKGHGSARTLRSKSKQDKVTTDTAGSKQEQRVQIHKWHEGPQSPNLAGQDKSSGPVSVGNTRTQHFRRPKVRQGLSFPKGPQDTTLVISASGSSSDQEPKGPGGPKEATSCGNSIGL